MRLRDYIALLRRRIGTVIVIIAAVAAIAVALAFLQKPTYSATVRLRVRPPAPLSLSNQLIQQSAGEVTDLGTEAALITSTRVAQSVIDNLHLAGTTPDRIVSSISVTSVPNTVILVLTAHAATPGLARDLGNAFANSYLQVRRQDVGAELQAASAQERSHAASVQARLSQDNSTLLSLSRTDPAYATVQAETDADRAELTSIENELVTLEDTGALSSGVGEIIQPANTASLVRSRAVTRTAVFGLLVGFPLALAVVLLLESFSDSIRTKEEAEQQTGSDLLGLIPFDPGWSHANESRLTTAIEPLSPVAEAHRTLAHNVLKAMNGTGGRIILVTSSGAGEGKSATAVNLAVALSDIGQTAIVVDANTRVPRAYEFLQADPSPGLADVLAGTLDASRAVQWLRPTLGFLAAGTASGSLTLALARADLSLILRTLEPETPDLASAKTRRPSARVGTPPVGLGATAAPIVLVDAAPVLAAGEVSALASAVDGALLVLRAGVTTRKGASLAADQIRRAGGRLLGAVLVGVKSSEELGLSGADKGYYPLATVGVAES